MDGDIIRNIVDIIFFLMYVYDLIEICIIEIRLGYFVSRITKNRIRRFNLVKFYSFGSFT